MRGIRKGIAGTIRAVTCRRSVRLFVSSLVVGALAALATFAEVQVIDGVKYECKDGLCYIVEDGGEANPGSLPGTRMTQGYLTTHEFISFLRGGSAGDVAEGWDEAPILIVLWIVLLGGLAMNLTPCVLPMVPINLMIIGRSAKRGLAYGLGIALAYGALGVAAAVGGLVFGDIQGNPWFNAVVAVVFVGLALALFDVWFLDLSRFRRSAPRPAGRSETAGGREGVAGTVTAFLMGALSAVLAGACVAPVLIAVLVFTADLAAKGKMLALGLPFVLGLGMALPWPFLGAGLRVLPKPGGWMKGVNRVFGVVVLGFAAWYGWLAWKGFAGSERAVGADAVPSSLAARLESAPRPVLVDCWATWCKNCAAMERVMEKPEVQEALKPFTVIRVQAEDISELRKVKGFEGIHGLPAFVIFE